MRVPSVDWLSKYMRSAGLVAAGAIIGAALFMAVYQHNFSLLYMENQRLKTENDDMRKTLEPYLKNKNRSSVVRQIKINLLTMPDGRALDEITTIQLKRLLAGDLESLRGRSVDSAAESMIVAERIIGRKVYSLEKDQEFTVDIRLILIKSGELTLWTEVRPHIRSN